MKKVLSHILPKAPILRGRKGFSLIEVLFAVTFLIMVGVAMATLNNAASRLTTTTELKQTALALNEQSLSFVAIEKRTNTNFATKYQNASEGGLISCLPPLVGSDSPTPTCYVSCPSIDTGDPCVLQPEKVAVTIGQNKLQFVPSVIIRPSGSAGRYLVNATVSWGSGIARQLTLARIIE
ncbi:MAG: hypothetical protein AAB774_02820 [Patescibacteria group bacterium]